MTATRPEDELTERLHRLTETIDGPVSPDRLIHAGRTKIRRHRAVGAAGAVSVFSAVCAIGVTTGLFGDGDDAQPVGGFASAPTTSATATGAGQTGSPHTDCRLSGEPPVGLYDRGDLVPEARRTLQGYRDLLAEHLDPQQQHLEKPEKILGAQSAVDPSCTLTSLGTKLGWTVAGQDGLGLVQVEVMTWSGEESQAYLAHLGWHPAPTLPEGAVKGLVAEYPGGTAVVVTRTDGITVAIDTADLFGNNSRTPVTGMDLSVDQLLETAADPGFQMPALTTTQPGSPESGSPVQ